MNLLLAFGSSVSSAGLPTELEKLIIEVRDHRWYSYGNKFRFYIKISIVIYSERLKDQLKESELTKWIHFLARGGPANRSHLYRSLLKAICFLHWVYQCFRDM